MEKRKTAFHHAFILDCIVASCALIFSFFLMGKTFGYDQNRHFIKIDAKIWSDFGSHIPLIRSFSMGDNGTRLLHNLAPEYPGFPGEPIRYHFGFYFLSGLMEKYGVRIDWAVNIPSALGLALLIFMTWKIAYVLFQSYYVGVLSVIFLLLNGSLGFLKFFQKYPFSWNTLSDMIQNYRLLAFGPWDGGPVTAFWSLNIYTNQRHLALSYGIALSLFYILLTNSADKQKGITSLWTRIVSVSLLMSFLLFINQATALALLPFLVWFFLVRNKNRILLLISGILTLPWFYYLGKIVAPAGGISWYPGYLAIQPLTVQSVLTFWFANLGLHTILIPVGLILLPKRIRSVLLIPLIVLFLVPNLIRFSPDMINNHKFFNFFMIFGGMLSAYTLVRIAREFRNDDFLSPPLTARTTSVPVFRFLLFALNTLCISFNPLRYYRLFCCHAE